MRLKKLQSLLIPLILAGFVSSCSLVATKHIPVEIPERPPAAECPALPEITGKIEGDYVVLPLEEAEKLRDWIHEYVPCMEITVIFLEAHIEKLENRLKAIP